MSAADIGLVLDRYRKEDEERKAFLEAFQCHDHTGATAPCAADRDRGIRHTPQIQYSKDGRWTACPLFEKVQCVLFQKIQAHQRAEQQAEWERIGRAKNIPTRFINASFQRVVATPAIDEMRLFVERIHKVGRRPQDLEAPGMLILLGGVGVGKTTALCCGVRAIQGARFLQADRFIQQVMDWDARAETMEAAVNASVLAFDDLGLGYTKRGGLAESAIEELICTRHAELRPMIISSNWTVDDLQKRLSPRVIDRFREWGKVVVLDGASLRNR